MQLRVVRANVQTKHSHAILWNIRATCPGITAGDVRRRCILYDKEHCITLPGLKGICILARNIIMVALRTRGNNKHSVPWYVLSLSYVISKTKHACVFFCIIYHSTHTPWGKMHPKGSKIAPDGPSIHPSSKKSHKGGGFCIYYNI